MEEHNKMTKYTLGILKGDGIGPEIVNSTVNVLRATLKFNSEINFNFEEFPMGWEGIKKYHDPVPQKTKRGLKNVDAWIMGTHDNASYPSGQRDKKRNPSGELRHYFDLFSNIRPSFSLPGVKSLVKNVDLIIIRENSEGFLSDRNMYRGSGEEMPTSNVSLTIGVFTKKAIARIAYEAFKLTEKRKKKLTIVHKANVIKYSGQLFIKTVKNIGRKYYPDVKINTMHVDAAAAALIKNPQQFDCLVTENLFGDILSDEIGQLIGGLGLSGSINSSSHQVMAQASHGAAPDIAGKNIANPTSMLFSVSMMLKWLGNYKHDQRLYELSEKIKKATLRVLKNGIKTPDIGGKATTTQFTNKVIENLF